jgi:hypothetical protein
MALVLADRVKVRSRTTGVGPLLLENTVAGFQSFNAVGDGNETFYGIYDTRGHWEIGRGVFSQASSSMSRDSVVSSSNNNQHINFLPGTKTVYSTLPSSVVNSIVSNSVSDSFKFIAITGQDTIISDSSTDTLTLIAGQNISLSTDISVDSVTINFTGDYTGSVFADSSTMMIDGTEGKIVGDINTSLLRTSEESIHLGAAAGSTVPGIETIGIGKNAGTLNQGALSVAIGSLAGNTNQGDTSIAIGASSGQLEQSRLSVALGAHAGSVYQGTGAVALGKSAGNLSQGNLSIAIGLEAGTTFQGDYAIAIGGYAGNVNQFANSIILNAQSTGSEQSDAIPLTTTTAGLFIAPVRNLPSTGQVLHYDVVTKELSYTGTVYADFVGSVFSDNSTLLVDGVEGKHYGPLIGNVTGNIIAQNGFVLIDADQSRHLGPLFGNVTGNVVGNTTGLHTGDSIGYHSGDVSGSIFADDSTRLIDATASKIVGAISTNYNIEILNNTGTLSFVGQGNSSILSNELLLVSAETLSLQSSVSTIITSTTGEIILDPALTVVIADGKILTGAVNITGTLTGTVDGEMIGSVYADDSTRVFDATNNSIATRSIITSVFTQFPVYANASLRNTAIPVALAGMVVVTGTSLTLYNGNAWVTLLATS